MNTMNVSILSQIQSRQVRPTLDDVFAEWAKPKEEIIRNFSDDVLALSCAIQRTGIHHSISESNLSSDMITTEDRVKAKDIRQYYKNKFTLFALKDKQLTKFRKDLHNFVYNESNSVSDGLIGMIYKLPSFYDYDLEIDSIFKSIYFKNTKDDTMDKVVDRNLKFIKKIGNRRRNSNQVEYWFHDEMLNKIMISFDAKNPLLSLLDDKLKQGPVTINARYHVGLKDFNRYYKIGDKWSFV